MKVLVTGGSGRLAPYVVRELVEHGHEVVLTSRTEPGEELAGHRWVHGDLNSFEDCRRAVEGVEAVQHLGAMAWPTDHPDSRERAEERGIPFDATFRTNLLGTYYLVHAAVEAGVGVLVMAGSNCALGIGSRIGGRPFPVQYLPMDERHPAFPADSYAFTKRAGEDLLAYYSRAYGIRTHVSRPAGICPPERRERMACQAGPTTGWNPYWCSWVGSEDVASAHRLLMERAAELPVHDVYFLNADDTAHLEPSRELIAKFRPDLLPLAEGMEGHEAFFSNRKLKEAVGWEHRTSWRDLR
jgi:nucleoside-diphosphate-sugar epimerase